MMEKKRLYYSVADLENHEFAALCIICNDCDDMDGVGFTRVHEVLNALITFYNNATVAGAYLKSLVDKGFVELELSENEVWVPASVYTAVMY